VIYAQLDVVIIINNSTWLIMSITARTTGVRTVVMNGDVIVSWYRNGKTERSRVVV